MSTLIKNNNNKKKSSVVGFCPCISSRNALLCQQFNIWSGFTSSTLSISATLKSTVAKTSSERSSYLWSMVPQRSCCTGEAFNWPLTGSSRETAKNRAISCLSPFHATGSPESNRSRKTAEGAVFPSNLTMGSQIGFQGEDIKNRTQLCQSHPLHLIG